MKGAMAFLAGMGTGYIKSKDKEYDRARQEEKDKRDQTLFDSQMEKINQDKADRTAMKFAGETVTARPLEGPQPESAYVNGQEPAEPIGYIAGNGASARTFASQGLADANAVEQNKPEARRTRMADLAMQGNTFASTALRDNVQTEAAMGQLKEQKDLQGQREFGRSLATAAQTGGWKGAAQFATDKYNDGNTYKAEEDGKGGAILIGTGKDGKEIGRMPFQSLDEYIMFGVSRADPSKWVDYKTGRTDKVAEQANKDRDFDLREKDLKRKSEADVLRAELAQSRLSAAAKSEGAGAYWNKEADKQLIDLNTSKDEVTGKMVYDGNGAQFMQAIALDVARKNGGNTMAAVARAAEVDQALKNMAKDDPAALAQLRGKALSDATGHKPPANTPAAEAQKGVVIQKKKPAITQSGSHQPVDPMRSQIQQPQPDVAAKLRDIDSRLQLQGVAPEVRLALIAERNKISQGGLSGLGSAQRFMN